MSACSQQDGAASGTQLGAAAVDVAEELACKGFTVRQLLQFYSAKGIGEFTTTGEVVRDVVIPETAKGQTCYMDSPFMQQHGGRHRAAKLVSHAWKSRFSTTVINILLDASGMAWAELAALVLSTWGVFDAEAALKNLDEQVLAKTYWLCIFAVNEHFAICGDCWHCRPQTREELAAKRCRCGLAKHNPCGCGALKYQPGDDQYEIDKFDRVVSRMSGLVVALDPGLTALTRIWVVAEICEASGAKAVVFHAASGLDDDSQEKLRRREALVPPVKDCEASSSFDKSAILDKIDNQDDYNDFIWSYTELCFGACHRLAALSAGARARLSGLTHLEIQCTWNKEMLCTRELELGAHFDILQGLRRLVIDMSYLASLTEIQSLAEGLAKLKRLQSLTLKFKGCKMLADVSPVRASFAELEALQELRVHFPGGGVTQLGTSLAGLRALQKLHLESVDGLQSFLGIAGVAPPRPSPQNVAGMSALGTSLAELKLLQELTLKFRHCIDLTDVSAFSMGIKSLPLLSELSLDFDGCIYLVDVSSLGSSLMRLQALRKLSLDWSGLSLVTLSALDSLACLHALQELHLAFNRCLQLEDISALGTSFAELRSLWELGLSFQACTKLVDLSELSRGLSELHALRQLCLDFCGCAQLADVSVLGATLVGLQALQKISVDFSECHQFPCALQRRFEDRAALSTLGQEIPSELWESRRRSSMGSAASSSPADSPSKPPGLQELPPVPSGRGWRASQSAPARGTAAIRDGDMTALGPLQARRFRSESPRRSKRGSQPAARTRGRESILPRGVRSRPAFVLKPSGETRDDGGCLDRTRASPRSASAQTPQEGVTNEPAGLGIRPRPSLPPEALFSHPRPSRPPEVSGIRPCPSLSEASGIDAHPSPAREASALPRSPSPPCPRSPKPHGPRPRSSSPEQLQSPLGSPAQSPIARWFATPPGTPPARAASPHPTQDYDFPSPLPPRVEEMLRRNADLERHMARLLQGEAAYEELRRRNEQLESRVSELESLWIPPGGTGVAMPPGWAGEVSPHQSQQLQMNVQVSPHQSQQSSPFLMPEPSPMDTRELLSRSLLESDSSFEGSPSGLQAHTIWYGISRFTGVHRIIWTVDAGKLRHHEPQAISPSFEMPHASARLVIFPKANADGKGSASFKKSGGWGSVYLKCEPSRGSASFMLSISDGTTDFVRHPRGPVMHNFADHSICGLPRDQEQWDFSKAVNHGTQTFAVYLDILPWSTSEVAGVEYRS